MDCKLLFALFTVFCVAQVCAVPVNQKDLKIKSKVARDFFDDVLAALDALELMVDALGDLLYKIEDIKTALDGEVNTELDKIFAILPTIGVSEDEMTSVTILAATTINKTKDIMNEVSVDIDILADVLWVILEEVINGFYQNLPQHIVEIKDSVSKLENDLTTSISRVTALAVELRDAILALIDGKSGPEVDQVTEEVNAIHAILMKQYDNVIGSLTNAIETSHLAIEALEKISFGQL